MKGSIDKAYWIGGVTRAGKTTIANILAEKHDLTVYSLDDHFDRHSLQSTEAQQPTMYAYQHDLPLMTQNLPPDEKAALWNRFYSERFPIIVSELAGYSDVVVEGEGLLPNLVADVAEASRVVWLLPTRDFWLGRHIQREWASVEDWGYYQARIEDYRTQCSSLGLHTITVDGARSARHVAAEIESVFELG